MRKIVLLFCCRVDDRFPDLHLPTREFNGVMFKDLPIVNVLATMNNTLINVSDSFGKFNSFGIFCSFTSSILFDHLTCFSYQEQPKLCEVVVMMVLKMPVRVLMLLPRPLHLSLER